MGSIFATDILNLIKKIESDLNDAITIEKDGAATITDIFALMNILNTISVLPKDFFCYDEQISIELKRFFEDVYSLVKDMLNFGQKISSFLLYWFIMPRLLNYANFSAFFEDLISGNRSLKLMTIYPKMEKYVTFEYNCPVRQKICEINTYEIPVVLLVRNNEIVFNCIIDDIKEQIKIMPLNEKINTDCQMSLKDNKIEIFVSKFQHL